MGMHADELPIDEPLVRRLVDGQFPQWAGLPLRRVEPWGTVHAIYRLGEDLSLRLPRRAQWSDEEHLLARWLPRFAPALPLAVPVPIAQGAPAGGYPCHWSVCTWIDGEAGVDTPWDPLAAARDLAAFVSALQNVDSLGGRPGRDRLADRGPEMRDHVERICGRAALQAWEAALAAPAWEGAPVWCHADLDARNWLVRDGLIAGIIDWESFAVGDPAADVMVAWKLRLAAARVAFRDALGVDDATWARARGWVVAQAAMALGYYTLENNRPLVLEARSWLIAVQQDGPVALAEYDAVWPQLYAQQEALIRAALDAGALLVEHVGSTAVPGLAAKPRIDIALAVADSSDEASYVPALEDAGFSFRLREPEWHEHRLLGRPDVDVNLHVFTEGCGEIERMLRFRDRLRAHDEDRLEYERTKRELAQRDWRYTQEYADAKSAVVEAILARA
jgi:GrpB-like predicted nucleotidyltransferase (UPF0157 family)